jgi:5'-nucleotidase
MASLGEVWVVAPDREQSASSHSLSLHRPLRIKKIRERWYSIDGTPADCTYMAINHLLREQRPDLTVSGINRGANMADDVIYSGTVAAAMESALLGVPAIAFSLVSRREFAFGPAARFAHALAKAALAQKLPPRLLLNVNIPGGVEPNGYAVTKLGKHSYGIGVVENVDPRGRRYYWIGGSEYSHENVPGSDCNAVIDEKRISVTPLHLDMTDHASLESVGAWTLEGFARFGGA